MPSSLKNLSGNYRMPKDSDDVSPVLALQGFGRMMRFAMSKAPVYIAINQKSDNEVEIKQTTTAAFPGVTEQWNHDWEWRERDDMMYKKIKYRSRWVKVKDVDDEWLKEGLDPEAEVIECFNGPPDEAWTAHQLWIIEGDRLVRKTVTTKGDGKGANRVQMRMICEPMQ
jgi:hypothetical protein